MTLEELLKKDAEEDILSKEEMKQILVYLIYLLNQERKKLLEERR